MLNKNLIIIILVDLIICLLKIFIKLLVVFIKFLKIRWCCKIDLNYLKYICDLKPNGNR